MAKLYLSSTSQIALWKKELVGQISDGHWENSRPHDHWEFWSDIEVIWDSTPRVETDITPIKNNYNFCSKELLEYVGDRMLSIGRMGKYLGKKVMDNDYRTWLGLANFLPYDYTELHNIPNYIGEMYIKELNEIPFEEYYSVDYTMKDLKKDLRETKKAIRNIVIV